MQFNIASCLNKIRLQYNAKSYKNDRNNMIIMCYNYDNYGIK